jgi:hypothetical protein
LGPGCSGKSCVKEEPESRSAADESICPRCAFQSGRDLPASGGLSIFGEFDAHPAGEPQSTSTSIPGTGLSEAAAIEFKAAIFEVIGVWKVAIRDNTRLYRPWEKPHYLLSP